MLRIPILITALAAAQLGGCSSDPEDDASPDGDADADTDADGDGDGDGDADGDGDSDADGDGDSDADGDGDADADGDAEVDADEPETCSDYEITLVGGAHPEADDYNRLLELATTGDWPYGSVTSFSYEGCHDYSDPQLWDALESALVTTDQIPWVFDSSTVTAGSFTAGCTGFADLLTDTRSAIDERISDGLWDPDETTEGRELYDQLDTLYDKIATDAAEGAFELWLETDAAECSEEAYGCLNTRTGVLLVVHRTPRC